MSDLLHVYKCSVENLLALASNVPDHLKRRGVRPELDTVLTILVLAMRWDQNDFLRVEDLPQWIQSHDTFMRCV